MCAMKTIVKRRNGAVIETTLPDGSLLLIRAVKPSDRAHLLSGFESLSFRSRFFRFLSAIKRLSDKDLDRFTAPGNDDHRAFGALDISGETPVPVAIARYERFPEERDKAEMAVTVVDAYQGRGVGTLIIGVNACCAARAGIGQFIAFVHRENHAMTSLLRALGATAASHSESELRLVLPIHRDPAAYPDNRRGDLMRDAYRLMEAAGESVGGPSG